MLDLAISVDIDSQNTTVIETNHGVRLKAPDWPQDSDFHLVAFSPAGRTCKILWTEALVEDIGRALMLINSTVAFKGKKPDWYRRLTSYSKGALPPRAEPPSHQPAD
jgi:hypothetical protein